MAAIPKDPSAEFVAFLKREKEREVEALVESFRKTVQEEANRRRMGKAWQDSHMEEVRQAHAAAAMAVFETQEAGDRRVSLLAGAASGREHLNTRKILLTRRGATRPVGHAPRVLQEGSQGHSIDKSPKIDQGETTTPRAAVEAKEGGAAPSLEGGAREETLPVCTSVRPEGPSTLPDLPDLSGYNILSTSTSCAGSGAWSNRVS